MPDRLTGRSLVIATGHRLSLALIEEGTVLARLDEALDRGHAERLMPAVADMLAPYRSDPPPGRLILETGPGSFTGLRVGAAAARALALAWNAALLGVRSTLLVAGATPRRAGDLLVALAAPRGQVWSERFGTGLESRGDPVAETPQSLAARLEPGVEVVGSGAALVGRVAGEAPAAAAAASLPASAFGPPDLLYVSMPGAGPHG
jgi:tRNA threonylcarbamoyl adenosine modification protein YeaZ